MGMPMMSINTEAGPSAPDGLPSSTRTVKDCDLNGQDSLQGTKQLLRCPAFGWRQGGFGTVAISMVRISRRSAETA